MNNDAKKKVWVYNARDTLILIKLSQLVAERNDRYKYRYKTYQYTSFDMDAQMEQILKQYISTVVIVL